MVRVSLVEPTVCGRLGRTAGTNGKSYLGHPSEGACSGFFHLLCPIKIWLEFQLLMDVGITVVDSNIFQNVLRSQFCNMLIVVGLKILQEQN